jgi:decaprenylphospho-beta-D-ribofuranose 2-oxidase
VEVTERRMADLDAFLEALEACRRTSPYSVGWIDGLARGKSLGRGILETAELTDDPALPRRVRRSRSVPFDVPGRVLNRSSVGAFNALYYRRVPPTGRTRAVPLVQHLHPLDALRHWNRLYGRRGFHQFQCVLPDREAARGLRELLEAAASASVPCFLATLKSMGGEGVGHLSFPRQGYSLALDLPHRGGTLDLLERLEGITLEHGGRIYLAKDSVLSPGAFRAMYPRHDAFRAVLDRVDPDERLSSDLARRIELRR